MHRKAYLQDSPFGSYYDKLLQTRLVFSSKHFDGFIQVTTEEAHKTGQYSFPKPKPAHLQNHRDRINETRSSPSHTMTITTNSWSFPSKFFSDGNYHNSNQGDGHKRFSMTGTWEKAIQADNTVLFPTTLASAPMGNWPLDRYCSDDLYMPRNSHHKSPLASTR